MSNSKISLPDFLIAELYKDSLVMIENSTAPAEKKPANTGLETIDSIVTVGNPSINFMGENRKNVSVLVNDSKHAFLPKDELDLLTKILSACNLNPADIAIINTSNQEVRFELMKEQFNPKVVLLFNVATISVNLPFTIPDFQIQPFDGCTFLSSPSLHTLIHSAEGRTLKGNLWTKLKQLFSA